MFSGEGRGGGDNKWVEKRDEVIADQRIVWICGQGGEEGKGQRRQSGKWVVVCTIEGGENNIETDCTTGLRRR